MIVDELQPGDLVDSFGVSALFVAATPHPLWPGLQLVVWRLQDGTWSHDALDARQEVGTARPANELIRRERLRDALTGGR